MDTKRNCLDSSRWASARGGHSPGPSSPHGTELTFRTDLVVISS